MGKWTGSSIPWPASVEDPIPPFSLSSSCPQRVRAAGRAGRGRGCKCGRGRIFWRWAGRKPEHPHHHPSNNATHTWPRRPGSQTVSQSVRSACPSLSPLSLLLEPAKPPAILTWLRWISNTPPSPPPLPPTTTTTTTTANKNENENYSFPKKQRKCKQKRGGGKEMVRNRRGGSRGSNMVLAGGITFAEVGRKRTSSGSTWPFVHQHR